MKLKTLTAALIIVLASWADTDKGNTETGNNKEASLQKLNEQSKECIRIMNKAEEAKNAALAAGDAGTAEAMQKTIDSAARANVKIGQEMAELK